MAIVILDRDGVINEDSPDYIKSPDEWQPITGSLEAIALLCNKGYRVYVATNQAGIARGLFDLETLNAMHAKLEALVIAAGGKIEKIFYCPHHPDENCACRKPKPGMLLQIANHANVELSGVPFVGDSSKDLKAALAVNARPILVRTGNGGKTEGSFINVEKIEIYDDLLSFARMLPAAG